MARDDSYEIVTMVAFVRPQFTKDCNFTHFFGIVFVGKSKIKFTKNILKCDLSSTNKSDCKAHKILK